MPASASRSVYLIDRYCDPRSEWCTSPACPAALMNGLFQGIEDEPGMRRAADPPADDAAGEGVDDEGDVDEALPGRDIGEIAHPQHVRRRHLELAVHLVQRAWLRLVGIVVLLLAADDALRPMSFISRSTVQRATSKPSRRIWPDLAHAVDLELSSKTRWISGRSRRRAWLDPTAVPDRPAWPGDRNRWMGQSAARLADRLDPDVPLGARR
jgi:hypothetical protein